MRSPRQPPKPHTWKVSDGYELRGRLWPPSRPTSDSAIVYLHGIQSHGGWFEWSASLLASGGAPVLLPDRRGSGLNAAARGDTPAAQRWLDDLDELADWAATEFGVRRCAVVGVSWGGKLALAWALQRPQRVSRLLLIAPGLFPAVDVTLLTRLRIGLALLTAPRRPFGIPLDDPALFTDSPEGRAFIAGDPLKLTQATARFFYESARLDRQLARTPAGTLQPPVRLLLAGRDRIICNESTVAWLRRIAIQRPEIHSDPDAAHTLEFELERTTLEEQLTLWLRT